MRTRGTYLVVVAMTLSLLAGSAMARRHITRPQPGRNNPGATFSDEYQEMVDVAKFSPVQKESLRKLLQDYDKAVKDNDAAKLDAAKFQVNAKTDEERKTADAKMKTATAQRDTIERILDVKAFEIMTPDQKALWTGYVLEKVFTDELSGLDPKLDDGQKVSLKAICQTSGTKSPSPDAANDTKLLDTVRKSISEKVLTEKQRTNYDAILDAKEKAQEDKDKKHKVTSDKPTASDKPKDKPTTETTAAAGTGEKTKPSDADAGQAPTTRSTGPLTLDIPEP